VIFGIGWGLAGYCPGPALVSLASGRTAVFVFVIAMVTGKAWQSLHWEGLDTNSIAELGSIFERVRELQNIDK
jgi:uncharacterized membrane protein YedE/YeeE